MKEPYYLGYIKVGLFAKLKFTDEEYYDRFPGYTQSQRQACKLAELQGFANQWGKRFVLSREFRKSLTEDVLINPMLVKGKYLMPQEEIVASSTVVDYDGVPEVILQESKDEENQ